MLAPAAPHRLPVNRKNKKKIREKEEKQRKDARKYEIKQRNREKVPENMRKSGEREKRCQKI